MLRKVYGILKILSILSVFGIILGCTDGGSSTPTDPGTTSGTTSGTTTPIETPSPTSLYSFGLTPTNINQDAVNSLYEYFMAYFYEENGSMARVKWDDATVTVSEGIGYGMLATLYAYGGVGDPVRFDKLLRYYLTFLNGKSVMSWKINGFVGVHSDEGSTGGATDADLDVAMALFEASKKWGNTEYLSLATAITDNISNAYVGSRAYDYYILSGDTWADGSYNASYISVVAFKEFALRGFAANGGFTPWTTISANNYNLLMLSQASYSGLWSDWMDESGTPAIPANRGDVGATYHKFYLDAVRTPWRVAWDYIWYGTPESKAMLDRLNFWAYNYHGGNPANINNEYTWWDYRAGSELSQVTSRLIKGQPIKAFYGAFGVAAMAGDNANDPNLQAVYQLWLDQCYAAALEPVTDRSYFDEILQLLYVQFMSGNFQKQP